MTELDGQGWVLRSLVVALPCSVLSCLLTLWLASPASSAAGVPPSVENTELLLARIDELRDQVDAGFRTAGRTSSGAPVERRPVSEVDPLAAKMNGALDRLEKVMTLARSGVTERAAALPRALPINWNELDALDMLHQRDREAAERSTMLLTMGEVIERFGFPTRTHSTELGHYLQYSRIGPDGERDGYVAFQIIDGYVGHHEINLYR